MMGDFIILQQIRLIQYNGWVKNQLYPLLQNKPTVHQLISNLMLTTYDVNKFIRTLTNYNQSLKSALNLSTVLNRTNLNVTSEIFNEDRIDQLFQHNKPTKPGHKKLEHTHQPKDYLRDIQFFRDVQTGPDRLISALPSHIYNLPSPKIEQLAQGLGRNHDLTRSFKQSYLVGKVIGEGAYASVRLALHKPTQHRVAIKVYEKGKLQKIQRKKSVQREIRILSYMNHRNILKILDVVQTNNHLNIIMEYLAGISLSEHLKKKQNRKLSERESKNVLKGLAQALSHMKTLNISHRDIKVENVILDDNLNPKLIDFGFSTCIESGKKIQIFCGTPNYMAPEIIMRKQFCGMKADIWALGVLLFVIVTGVYPFKGSTDEQLYNRIINLQYPKYLLIQQMDPVLDLISRMLKFNPDERITPEEILIHPWMLENNRNSLSKNTRPLISPIKRQRVSTTMSNYKENKPQSRNRVNIKSPTEIRKQLSNNVRIKQFLNNTLKPTNRERLSQKKSQPKYSSKQKPKKIAKDEITKSSQRIKAPQPPKLNRSKSKTRLA